jgi:hypothetical protein
MSSNFPQFTIANISWRPEVIDDLARFLFVDLVVNVEPIVLARAFLVDVINPQLSEQIQLLSRNLHRLLEQNPCDAFIEWRSCGDNESISFVFKFGMHKTYLSSFLHMSSKLGSLEATLRDPTS